MGCIKAQGSTAPCCYLCIVRIENNQWLLYDGYTDFCRGGITMDISNDERKLLDAVHHDPDLRSKIWTILKEPGSPDASPAMPPETPR